MKRSTLFAAAVLWWASSNLTLASSVSEKGRDSGEQKPVPVRHFEYRDGWARAETANFRIYHNQSKDFVEKVATVAERTRSSLAGKWFGGFKEDWTPRCDVVLYSTAEDYSRSTGISASSPGRSFITIDGGRVTRRQMDLHCDNPTKLLLAILPHETAHVVLAGQFGERQIPRWADEGVAVLSEPRERIERHLRTLPSCSRNGLLFHVRDLMELTDYPEPQLVTAFYAQSVSLVEFLANEKGPQVFAQFLRDALIDGYTEALKRHYGYRTFDELERKWSQHALAAAPAVASKPAREAR